DPGARGDASSKAGGRGPSPRLRTRAALPGTWHHEGARRPAARPAAVRARRAHGDPRGRHRPAHRDHEGRRPPVALRPRRFALPQPEVLSVTSSPGADAVSERGDWPITLPCPEPTTLTFTLSFASRFFARPTELPTTCGIAPCRDLATTRWTSSYAESVPFDGYWPSTTFSRWPVRAGLKTSV